MLRAYLLSVKQKSILSQIEALAAVRDKIGQEWSVGSEGLQRTFEFKNFEHANNFLVRYNSYCEKV